MQDVPQAILHKEERGMKLKENIIVETKMMNRQKIFLYFRNTKNLFKHKRFRRIRESGSATVNDFQNCTISHLNMILAIIVFIEQVNIVCIIG